MYATFTGLRLNSDGRAFYGMAASPPLLHWRAKTKQTTRIQEEQFPLGLLQVSEFPSSELVMDVDDVLMIATDGIYEVSSKGEDFGIGTLEGLLRENASAPLAELASTILKSVRRYGKQVDDQTLLLVRRTSR
jgi:serine phosphatase RsbU (regulator of sigma subunit)